MPSPQRAGKERPTSGEQILDAVEALMVGSGHAAVTYRAVAARASVTPSLVQYYFPTLDELLVATVRRRSEQSLRRLVQMLQARPSQPLRVLWEFSKDETNAALTIEFSAMGNHRSSVRAEIVDHMRRLRQIQLESISAGEGHAPIPPAAALFLLSGIPKMLKMEEDFELEIGHEAIVELVERYLQERERDAT